MAHFIRKTLFGGLLSLGFVASFSLAGTQTLTPEEARALAWRALQNNKPNVTLKVADALIKRDPKDFEVALLRAEALRAMGQKKQAVKAAKSSWKKADTKPQRFDAAHLMAKTHFANGSESLAQFWLRRAAQNAPNEQAKQIAVRDFRFVRENMPFTTRVNFGIFPSSNINNGSPTSDIEINGIPFRVPASGQPHSGTGATLGVHSVYRKSINKNTQLRLGFKASGTTYRLSSDAKALGSGKKGSDFSYVTAELQAGITFFPKTRKAPGWGATSIDVAYGHNWYGGDHLSQFNRLSFQQDYFVSKVSRLRFNTSLERQNRKDNAASSATVTSVGLEMLHVFQDRSRLTFGAGYRASDSQSNTVDSTAMSGHISYTTKPLKMNIQPTFSLNYQDVDFSRLVVGTTQRQDKKLNATISILFPEISYYGFAPTLNLSASQTKSTIPIYSTKDLRMNIGFQSTF